MIERANDDVHTEKVKREIEPWRIDARKHVWRDAEGNIKVVCQRCGAEYAEAVAERP